MERYGITEDVGLPIGFLECGLQDKSNLQNAKISIGGGNRPSCVHRTDNQEITKVLNGVNLTMKSI